MDNVLIYDTIPTSMITYTRSTFELLSDKYITIQTRRCVKPHYDKGNEKYTLADEHDIRVVNKDNPLFYSFNERLNSPLTKNLRVLNLTDDAWADAEQLADDSKPGFRIQVYSIIDAINNRSAYYLERLDHPTKKWRRVIITHHLSELCLLYPHKVKEIHL